MATRVSDPVDSDRLNTSSGQGARQVGPKRVATEYLPIRIIHIINMNIRSNEMSTYTAMLVIV